MRAFLQLLAVGYILDWVFSVDRWYLVAAMLFLMVGTASYNAMRRQTVRFRGLTIRFIISIAFASAVGIFVGLGLIVRSRPLWDPQYMIPIGGMIIGNAMTSGALAVNRLYSEITSRRGEIEAALSLGASPHIASISAARAAVKAYDKHNDGCRNSPPTGYDDRTNYRRCRTRTGRQIPDCNNVYPRND